MVKVLAVPGTWAWRGDLHDHRDHWWHPQSQYFQFLGTADCEPLCQTEPFVWTTHLNGAAFWRSSHLDWQAGGASLYYYINNPAAPGPDWEVPLTDRRIIGHSHALQVVLYACAYRGLQIHTLVSVCSPIRHDMAHVARAARPHIHRWLHIYSDWSDKTQWFGSWFDRQAGVDRDSALADWNVRVPGVGHSGLLSNPDLFHLWEERGWLEYLKTP